MTKYWTTNQCSINQNTIFSDWDAQGFRKGLYTELFFLFFIYFISQVLQAVYYKNTRQRQENNTQIKQPMTSEQQNNKKQLPWHEKKWNRTFAMIFSHNCVAVGMCVLFSPFQGSVVIAYFHLFFFMLYCVFEIKLMVLPSRLVRILMDLCNLTLILIGTISINLNTCKGDFTCKGVQAGTLTSSTCFN